MDWQRWSVRTGAALPAPRTARQLERREIVFAYQVLRESLRLGALFEIVSGAQVLAQAPKLLAQSESLFDPTTRGTSNTRSK